MKEITDSKGRKIWVVDGAVSLTDREAFMQFIQGSFFQIGAPDNMLGDPNVHSRYSPMDIHNMGIMNTLPDCIVSRLSDYAFTKSFVNVSYPTDINHIHTHKKQLVLLYYPCLQWEPHYFGETLFFEEDLVDIVYAGSYVPGRMVLFDGEIPHSIRPHSPAGPKFRFTLALMFDRKVSE